MCRLMNNYMLFKGVICTLCILDNIQMSKINVWHQANCHELLIAVARAVHGIHVQPGTLTVVAKHKGAQEAIRDVHSLLGQLTPACSHEFPEGAFA